jgi:putative oxygen-independent coproporphyrinogen III oxidase
VFGVYVHFPYCLARCPYCDFALVVARRIDHRRYARAVIVELERRSATFSGRRSQSIYFGGGTPSLWEPPAMAEVIEAIRTAFDFDSEPEITVEANPEAADAGRFAAYRRLGVNRLSIGVQSFDPRSLAALGRRHSGSDAVRAFRVAREAGFSNVSVDLMFGAPGQSVAVARDDAERAIALRPDHVSAYALTLENLAFEVSMARAVRRGSLEVPGQDDASEQGDGLRAVFRGAGFQRYEISNFAQPGFESRHNLLYWHGGEYLGLGAGACGFSYRDPARPAQGGIRYGNLGSPDRYMSDILAGGKGERWSEALTKKDLLNERVMLGLRLTRGFDLDATCATFEEDASRYRKPVAELSAAGLAEARAGWLTLTERGLDLHTEAALRLM